MTIKQYKYFSISHINPQVGDLVRSTYWVNSIYGRVEKIRHSKGDVVGAWIQLTVPGILPTAYQHKKPVYFGETVGKELWRKINTVYEFQINRGLDSFIDGIPYKNDTYKELFYEYI